MRKSVLLVSPVFCLLFTSCTTKDPISNGFMDPSEICGDGVDNGGDGNVDLQFWVEYTADTGAPTVTPDAAYSTTWYADADGDGYGDDATATVVYCDGATLAPSDYVTTGGDCADADATINPEADEYCSDGLDSDCDGSEDAGAVDASTVPWDSSGDGICDGCREFCGEAPAISNCIIGAVVPE